MIQVEVYSKPGCHLCEVVMGQLERLRSSHPFELREVNILDTPEHFARYKDEIPVVFIDGRKAFKYHLDEADFLRRLERIRERETRGA